MNAALKLLFNRRAMLLASAASYESEGVRLTAEASEMRAQAEATLSALADFDEAICELGGTLPIETEKETTNG